MVSDSKRLRRVLQIQEKLKAVHEMRHATLLASAEASAREAADIAARFEDPDSLSELFPDLYVRRIKAALANENRLRDMARREAERVAEQTARVRMVERQWKDAAREEERKSQEAETLEAVANSLRANRGDTAG
jgi:hypothetical protein